MTKRPPIQKRSLPVLAEQAKQLRGLAQEMHDTNAANSLGPKYAEMIETIKQAAEIVEAEIAARSQST